MMFSFRMAVFAHGYSQVLTIALQLVSLPVFLSYWSIEEYGWWLMLSAVPTYLALSDFGLLSATSNRMTMLRAAGNIVEAERLFSECLSSITHILLALLALVGLLISLLYVYGLPIKYLAASLYLCLMTIVTVANGLVDLVYRPIGQYHKGVLLLSTARLMEWLFGVGSLALFERIDFVAAGYLLGRVFWFIVSLYLARRDWRSLCWKPQAVPIQRISNQIKSGLPFLGGTISSLINIQGVMLLVGSMLGPSAAAVFATHRTYARIVYQFSNIAARSIGPELSRMIGAGSYFEAFRKMNAVLLKCGATSLLGAIILFFVSDLVFDFWTHEKIKPDPWVLVYLLLGSVLMGLVGVGSTIQNAANNNARLAVAMIGAALFSVVAAWVAIVLFSGKLPYISAGLLVGELFMLLWLYSWFRSQKIHMMKAFK